MQLVAARAVRRAHQPRARARAAQALLPLVRLRAAGRGQRRRDRALARPAAQLPARGRCRRFLRRDERARDARAGACSRRRCSRCAGAGTSTARSSCCASRGGKKNPPPIQRMEADDVMAAVFPALAACQENAHRPASRSPTTRSCARRCDDCLHEAMDVDGLERAARRRSSAGEVRAALPRHDRAVAARARDPEQPARTPSSTTRRSRSAARARCSCGAACPSSARELAALDPDGDRPRARRGRARAARRRRAARRAARARACCGRAPRGRPGSTRWSHGGRALHVDAARQRALVRARARARTCEALLPAARFAPEPRCRSRSRQRPRPSARSAARDVVRGHLDAAGPVARAPSSCARDRARRATRVRARARRSSSRGLRLRGRFDRASSAQRAECCARRLLARIHAYTQERLRREIEPVTRAGLHALPAALAARRRRSTQLEGRAGLLARDRAAPGLRARRGGVGDAACSRRASTATAPEWLDDAVPVGPGRLGPAAPARAARRARRCRRAGERGRAATLVARHADHARAARRLRAGCCAAARARGRAAAALDATTRAGARAACASAARCSSPSSRARSGLRADALREALWDGVARGLVTADGFGALRALLAPARAAAARARPRRRGLRGGAARRPRAAKGRWALVAAPPPSEREPRRARRGGRRAAARALGRGLPRPARARERCAVPWREILWALRRLEARGVVRGGRFVTGFVGEQYALPEAVERCARCAAARATARSCASPAAIR